MKLQRSTLILLLSALVLGGFVYVYEVEGGSLRQAEKERENRIFAFEENQVQSARVKTTDKTLLFERNSQKPGEKSLAAKWLMTVVEQKQAEPPKATDAANTPEVKPAEAPKEKLAKVPANEAYVAYLLDQMVKAKGDRVPVDPRISYGLDQPQAVIDVTLTNGKTHQLILGKPNFNRRSLYAIADPPNEVKEPLSVVLVSTDFENAVNRPLSEWRQPEEKQPEKSEPKTDKPAAEAPKQEPPKSEKPAAQEGAEKNR